MNQGSCYHCGEPNGYRAVVFEEKRFCCSGCKTVYQIFQANDLSDYYELQAAAGKSPESEGANFDFLDLDSVSEKLLEFSDGHLQVVNLNIPHIHCSSCIWVLENLNKLAPGICGAVVDFPKKSVRVTYDCEYLSLKELVKLLASIGYTPAISLDQMDPPKKAGSRELIYKLGVAGFAFGNVMFLSFPEYFDPGSGPGNTEFWLQQYKQVFRFLMFVFSLPVLLYASNGYLKAAYKGLRAGILNMDVPIALGIVALFARSTLEVLFDWGPGYFDSFTGLVFFLLLGKFFQQRTYSFLSFERDYKSYFPIAVTRIGNTGLEENIPVYDLQKGDRLLIRNRELIPTDGILRSRNANIDYSFVTGESEAVPKTEGDKIYAGGKLLGGYLEMEVSKPVSQSYLTQLWGNTVFNRNKSDTFRGLTDRVGKQFTIVVLSVAILASAYWLFADPTKAANVFTAVLIIACPCALALAAPFTLGNVLRIFGKRKFYLKNTETIEQMAHINTVVFDKTGTITSTGKSQVAYEGIELSEPEESLLKNTLRASNHPLSRKLYDFLAPYDIVPLDDYTEEIGQGMRGTKDRYRLKLGSLEFVKGRQPESSGNTEVHISSNDTYKGCFIFKSVYRDGLARVFARLSRTHALAILSGDNASERTRLEALLPKGSALYFNKRPDEKLHFVEQLQAANKKVMMVGDGLNDAGALAQSDVGIAISEDINVFSPACDAILDASKFEMLPDYIGMAKKAVTVIKASFLLSLSYNIIGLYFAVTGQLEPVIAAILMPLSSISIVGFTTLATNLMGRKLR